MRKFLASVLAGAALSTLAFAESARPHVTSADETAARRILMKQRLKGGGDSVITGYESCAYLDVDGKVKFATYCDGYQNVSGEVDIDHRDDRSIFKAFEEMTAHGAGTTE